MISIYEYIGVRPMVVDANAQDMKIEKILKTTSLVISGILIISSLLLIYFSYF
jgi:hypothetical protein